LVKTLLYRYTGQGDIIIGSPSAGRDHPDLEDQVGVYVNTLALRDPVSGSDPFSVLIDKVKNTATEASDHRYYPFDLLVEELDLKTDVSRSPVFDVMVNVEEENESHEFTLEGIKVTPIYLESVAGRFDLFFNFRDRGTCLEVDIEYNRDLFKPDRVTRMWSHLLELVTCVPGSDEQLIKDLNILTNYEKHLVLEAFNQTGDDYPRDTTVVDLFETQAGRTPDRVAVVFEDRELTYGTLNEQSNRMAHHLHSQLGVQPDDPVGLMAKPSHWMIIGILGILKAGGAYVPIDPDCSQEQVDFILSDSGADVLIRGELPQPSMEDAATGAEDGQPFSTSHSSTLAYILYSLDSTGQSRGVMVGHRSVVNVVLSLIRNIYDGQGVGGQLKTGITITLYHIFPALVQGHALHIISHELKREGVLLNGYIKTRQIDIIEASPSLFTMLLDTGLVEDHCKRLKTVMLSGEPFHAGQVKRFYGNGPEKYTILAYLYGPGESGVPATFYEISKSSEAKEEDSAPVSIGKPLSNTGVYILDPFLQPVPLMVPGEIYLSGDGLAQGYIDYSPLTAERFIPHPFKGEGERLYRTGDRGQWLLDGNIRIQWEHQYVPPQVETEQEETEKVETEKEPGDIPVIPDAPPPEPVIPDAIRPIGKKEYYPLSAAQQRFFELHYSDPQRLCDNIPAALVMEGEFSFPRLEQTVKDLVRRHESLRTSFHLIGGEPVQRVHDAVEVEIEKIGPEPGEEEKSREYRVESKEFGSELAGGFIRPFDLSVAPLLRVGLVTHHAKRHILLYDMHHIISDRASMQVFANQFSLFYSNYDSDEPAIGYNDFAAWQNRRFDSPELGHQEAYWQKKLEGPLPVLNMLTDWSGPAVQGDQSDTLRFELDEELTARLRQLAENSGATLYMVLLAIYNVLLSRTAGQDDIIVGSPTAGRNHPHLEHIIGTFTNTLAMRNQPRHRLSFSDFLGEVKTNALEAVENQDYPFHLLAERLNPDRDTHRNPVFDTMLTFQSMENPEMQIKGIHFKSYTLQAGISKFDLTLHCREEVSHISAGLEYAVKLFKEESIRYVASHFVAIARRVTANPDALVTEISMLSPEERQQVLFEFNATAGDYPKDKTIIDLFENQVERTPERIALTGAGPVSFTYNGLSDASGRVAKGLMEKGVKPDDIPIIGIMMERSVEMVIGILGSMKAGGAYLPIETDCPEKHIDFMLRDSRVEVLIRGELPRFSLESAPAAAGGGVSHAGNLAYILYPPGTTGSSPQPVMVEHSSVLNLLSALHQAYSFRENNVYLLKTPVTSDVSVTELFGWFWEGGRLEVLEPAGEKKPAVLLDTIQSSRVTHINFVPSMFNVFVDFLISGGKPIHKLSGLRYIFLSGQTLLPGLVEKFRSLSTGIPMENFHGPAEATVFTSRYSLSGWTGDGPVPIGKPILNTCLYILDENDAPQAIGVPGELCISGVGVARGYLNRPELTAEKFNKDFKDGQDRQDEEKEIYRTGDLARWLPDGNIELLDPVEDEEGLHVTDQEETLEPSLWLMFTDESGVGGELAERLQNKGRRIIIVKTGSQFVRHGDTEYSINSKETGDYVELFTGIMVPGQDEIPGMILHLLSLPGSQSGENGDGQLKNLEQAFDRGFQHLLHISRALDRMNPGNEIDIKIISHQVHDAAGEDDVNEKKPVIHHLTAEITITISEESNHSGDEREEGEI
ncbi:MAG: AMP-binding protein, partial [bacterium]|nr:AMP-binding protein [bacterium]